MSIARVAMAVTLVALAGLLPAAEASAAAPGELDSSFGVGGKAQPFGPKSSAGGVAVLPDGRILVAGSSEASGFSVARLLPDGAADPSWGAAGVAATPLGESAYAADVAVQQDGKVVAVGEAPGAEGEDFAIVRYLANGTPDPGFGGGDGVVVLPVGALGDQAHAVAVGPGGRIAVVGVAELPAFRDTVGVAMLEPDGTPEAAFAGDGTTMVTTESEEDDRGEAVAFQPDGKIVIADSTGAGGGDGFTLIRLGLDGTPDHSFDGDGVVETLIPGEGEVATGRVSDVVIQPDGKIVGGGYGFDYTGTPREYVGKFAAVRYRPNGELDPSFGNGGIVSVRPQDRTSYGSALGLAADGKLILGGEHDVSENPLEERDAAALVRFKPNGELDPTFGSGGVVLGPLESGVEDEGLGGLAIQPSGKIVASSTQYRTASGFVGIVSRYLADFETPPLPLPPASAPPLSKPDEPPHSRIGHLRRRVRHGTRMKFHGTASDPDGTVEKVEVALVRLRHRGRAGTSARVKPRHWRTARGTAKWTLKLRHPLAPGRYVIFSRAIDDQGLAEAKFSRRDGNRRSFRVLRRPRP
jgi:uncharacterized delta-60 repeat protein